ncbi:Trk system potassium transport protein TrkA [Snodgrassella alvi]|uniref:Trk system potassium transporter TrkA n=1 Tax=Snodgrassella alvi TaxID=1196083 RepID=UPI0009FD0EE1|nr:Trk system potassium transporter TrkA [Snodgrassella alvi]ORF26551.1 Trk system potassium transport protein TrkA [Snodgrassella alvi]ORF30698.1 Trk system potassium transport protein TrkA [Snodgrassella alvi]ORF34218.1 Trk system potassium transport protein TrkA [Snodgrassella alvi]ORF38756.1 Trk system potassium transport protein TrkA [Snodgrassella alvi]ORF38902.1 Trk system potassium transport protein TrkA [Snodgrassella alvi]
MKILILGCGQVGSTIASNLARMTNNDVTIIDINESALQQINQRLDVQTIVGNGAWPSVLSAAGAQDADMILALTQNDETNMAACRIAYALFNTPNRIARVRYSDFVEFETGNNNYKTSLDLFNITEAISPEQLVTEQIVNLLLHSSALQILRFAHDKIRLLVIRAQNGGMLVNQPISNLKQHLEEGVDCQICAIYRNNHLLVPTGSTVIQEDDEVFVLTPTAYLENIMRELRPINKRTRRIMIAGGGNIGYRVARQLETKLDIKIIERKQNRAEWLAENLNNTLVLVGNASDESLLENEYIDEIDVFCALTNDDENNIMSAMLAKNLGAKRVMAIINRSSYVDLLQGSAIDIVISPHLITIGSILTHVHLGDIMAVYPLRRGSAEAIEVVLHGDRHTSKLIGRTMTQLRLPAGCYFGAVIRNEKIIMYHQDTVLADGDHVIFFIARRKAVQDLEKMIQVKLGFFA